MRMLVEQVIRHLKIFKIFANEVPITVIPQLADIVIVCSALTNLSKTISNILLNIIILNINIFKGSHCCPMNFTAYFLSQELYFKFMDNT